MALVHTRAFPVRRSDTVAHVGQFRLPLPGGRMSLAQALLVLFLHFHNLIRCIGSTPITLPGRSRGPLPWVPPHAIVG